MDLFLTRPELLSLLGADDFELIEAARKRERGFYFAADLVQSHLLFEDVLVVCIDHPSIVRVFVY